MKKIILFGFGGHAISCLDIILENNFEIIGYFDNEKKINSSKFKSIDYLGNDTQITKFLDKNESSYGLVSFGSHLSLEKRSNLYKTLQQLGINFLPIISSSSYVSKMSHIEQATIIMHKVVINIGVTVKDNCIINTGTIVDHESIIEKNCIISTNVTINGQVKVGEKTFIGSGAIISNNMNIGSNCIIGAGVTIKKDIPNNSIIK